MQTDTSALGLIPINYKPSNPLLVWRICVLQSAKVAKGSDTNGPPIMPTPNSASKEGDNADNKQQNSTSSKTAETAKKPAANIDNDENSTLVSLLTAKSGLWSRWRCNVDCCLPVWTFRKTNKTSHEKKEECSGRAPLNLVVFFSWLVQLFSSYMV